MTKGTASIAQDPISEGLGEMQSLPQGGEARSPKPRHLKLLPPQQDLWVCYPVPFICSFDTLKMPGGWGGSSVFPFPAPTLQPVTSPGPGATAGSRHFLTLNNFSRVKEKLQQELGRTGSCERFQQIYPKSFT